MSLVKRICDSRLGTVVC